MLCITHVASLVDQFERYALKELHKGNVVICDRYIYSIIVRGLVRGINEKFAFNLLDIIPKPTIVFYLDIDPTEAINRIGEKMHHFGNQDRILFIIFQRKSLLLIFKVE